MNRRPYLVAIALLLSAGASLYACSSTSGSPSAMAVKPSPTLGWCYDLMKPGYATLPICGYPWQNDRGNGINITADWDGSCFGEHGPQCLPHPSPKNCAVIGPGWAAHLGTTCGYARRQLAGEAASKQGFYFITDDGTALHLNGPNGKNQCMKLAPAPRPRRSYCFGIGKIGNTEGSAGGP